MISLNDTLDGEEAGEVEIAINAKDAPTERYYGVYSRDELGNLCLAIEDSNEIPVDMDLTVFIHNNDDTTSEYAGKFSKVGVFFKD